MMVEKQPTLDTVAKALDTSYNSSDEPQREKALAWLAEFQKSIYAWQIADQLLHTYTNNLPYCFFAAQTMKTKVQRFFHELPPESYDSLRKSLLEHIEKVNSSTPHNISTQLSIALADFVIQLASWKSATSDILQMLGSKPEKRFVLLEILTLLPEELNNRAIRVGANRRRELTHQFEGISTSVLEVVVKSLNDQTSNDLLRIEAMRCLGSWFRISAFEQTIVLQSHVLDSVFKVMTSQNCSSSLHEAATDCLSQILYCAENLDKYRTLAELLFVAVHGLRPQFLVAMEREDIDRALNYCRVFTEMGESFVNEIVTNPGQGLGSFSTLELLLETMKQSNIDLAEISFNFWYRLSELLYHSDDQAVTSNARPYFEQLILALCRLCEIEPDHSGLLDESDDFNDFRLRSADLVQDSLFLLGAAECFQSLYVQLQQASGSVAHWPCVESSLFFMAIVAKCLNPNEHNNTVSSVLHGILGMPQDTHVCIRYSMIGLIGELAPWLDKHIDHLDPVLNFLLATLQDKVLASCSAHALQNICNLCTSHMKDHFPLIVQIVNAIDSLTLTPAACNGLLKGAALVLAQLPHEAISSGLEQLCSAQVASLNNVLRSTTNSDPELWIDRLAVIFRHMQPRVTNGEPHPCHEVIVKIWPVLSETLNKYQRDVKTTERCCRCIRFAIRCLGLQSTVLLSPLVNQMVSLYGAHKHSCFLYLGSILIDEYGSQEECVPGLLAMLEALSETAFKQLNEDNGFVNHPDTVDDLFRAYLRFVQRNPLACLRSQSIQALLECAVAAASLIHKEANASLMRFLADLFNAGSNDFVNKQTDSKLAAQVAELVKAIYSRYGLSLVTSLLRALIYSLQSYQIPDVAEVFTEMIRLDRQSFLSWLQAALQSLPTENSAGVVNATHEQMEEFLGSLKFATTQKEVSSSLKAFRYLFR